MPNRCRTLLSRSVLDIMITALLSKAQTLNKSSDERHVFLRGGGGSDTCSFALECQTHTVMFCHGSEDLEAGMICVDVFKV